MARRILAAALLALTALGAWAEKVECVCVFYPHWHRYPKGDEWFGADRWKQGEWAFVKDARPLYPNHKQPLVPYAGFLDESDPKDMAKEIALAANAGIDVFLYDYYWYDGQITQEEALEKGFLQAPNRDRMKFAIMWCYHERNDQFRPELGAGRRRLMSLAHTKEEFLGLIDHCIARYFARPEYWRKDGKLFFSFFNFNYFYQHHGANPAAVKVELDEARARVRAAGLGEIHFNAQNVRAEMSETCKACGIDSLTDYNMGPGAVPSAPAHRAAHDWQYDYAEMPAALAARLEKMKGAALPYIPNVTTGWDSTPRCRYDERYPWRKSEYPYSVSFTNNTPDIFRTCLVAAKKWAEEDPRQPGAVYINGWNEYTEGTYLVPNNFDSDGFLRAIAAVFGRSPANEYTYVNPSTKQLFTIPAATYEDVPYGPHPKQKIDVFLPGGRAGARPSRSGARAPVVIYLHGGGWSGGAMEDHILGSSIRMLLDRGIAVVGTGYRYIRDAQADGVKPPVMGCLDDCENALRFVKAHADEWNLDVSRIGLAGGSAGACTALYLALKDGNMHGIRAVAPIIAQTSMDPQEMKEWIPNSRYGAHAFGYRNFADWLAHRAECLADIERISPAALARKIDPAKAPAMFLQYGAPLKPGEIAKDPVHSPVFGGKFRELCAGRGIPCKANYGGEAYFGDAFTWLASELQR